MWILCKNYGTKWRKLMPHDSVQRPFSAFPGIPLVFFPIGFTHYVIYPKLTQDSRKYFSHFEKAFKKLRAFTR